MFRSTCTECYGTRDADDCDTCKGSGARDWDRCPASQTDDFGMYVSEVWENLQVEQNWPNGLPWAEQSNVLYCAVMLYGQEVAEIQKAQREKLSKAK